MALKKVERWRATEYQRDRAIDKLTAEVETLGRVVAAQSEVTAKVRREWSMFADEIARRVAPAPDIDAAKALTYLSTG